MKEQIKYLETISELWETLLEIKGDKEFNKNLFTWAKILFYIYSERLKSGYVGSILECIEEVYQEYISKENVNKAFNNLYNKIRLIEITCNYGTDQNN